MRTLNETEILCVSGSGLVDAMPEKHKIEAGGALGLATSIGFASFGAKWGTMGAVAAFGIAPIAVVGIAALAGYAGYRYVRGS